MREIAAAAGILAGSLYYHFASKEELFVAVHGAGMEAVERSVREALEGIETPWSRLEAAAAAHAGALFSVAEIVTIVTPKFPASIGRLRGELVRQRDAYEHLIADLVDALELPESVNRKMFRLQFLGALNWMQTWYQIDGKLTPQELGRQIVTVLRHGYERTDKRLPKT
jgi:AcrR family transcriptional regulator